MTSMWEDRRLLPRLLATILVAWLSLAAVAQQRQDGAEQLGMALEYFQGGKYHESLLIFQRLDKKYKLNPRFRAYIGLCYYYEWNYKKSVEYFDKVLPLLGGLAPHELSVYYYSAGESYFQMQQYAKALPYYEKDLTVCYNQEKGDVCYRIGLCHMFAGEWQKAYDSYSAAETYYTEYRDTKPLEARLAQIENMKNGCMNGISKNIDKERSRMLNGSDTTIKEDDAAGKGFSPWESITLSPFILEDNHDTQEKQN